MGEEGTQWEGHGLGEGGRAGRGEEGRCFPVTCVTKELN